jgi:hypothetical protein
MTPRGLCQDNVWCRVAVLERKVSTSDGHVNEKVARRSNVNLRPDFRAGGDGLEGGKGREIGQFTRAGIRFRRDVFDFHR